MCIIARKAHLSDTSIFTCVCGIEEDEATRQLVMYQNKVSYSKDSTVSDNVMCLPFPLKAGLIAEEHVQLYDFSSENKSPYTSQLYKDFFVNIEKCFKVPTKSTKKSKSRSRSAEGKLSVVKVGGYLCSLASSISDLLLLDSEIFGDAEGLKSVLETNYPKDFGFLACKFSREKLGEKEIALHPILYSHPIAADKSLFIPTKHYHGGEKPNEEFVDDWDHNIYVLGADVEQINNIVENARFKPSSSHGLSVTPSQTKFIDAVKTPLVDVLKKTSKNDKLTLTKYLIFYKIYGENYACKIHINGKFSNIDLQPPVLLKGKDSNKKAKVENDSDD